MPVTVREKFDSRSGDDEQIDLLFVIEGTNDDAVARAALATEAPTVFNGLVRQKPSIEPLGENLWDGRVRYVKDSYDAPKTGDSAFSFDTTGGTQHITQSKANIAKYAPSGETAPDFGGAIGVTHDTDQPRFAVMGIGSPILSSENDNDHFKSEVTFSVSTPTTSHRGKFVVLQEPLAAGAIGIACVSGVSLVKLHVPENGLFDYADVTDGDATLLTCAPNGSAAVLWREDTSDGWAVVRLGNAIPDGVAFQVWLTQDGGDAGSATVSCSWTYTVHPFGNLDFELATEQSPKRYRLPLIEYENAGESAGANIGLACYESGQVVLLDVLTERPKLNPDCEETTS